MREYCPNCERVMSWEKRRGGRCYCPGCERFFGGNTRPHPQRGAKKPRVATASLPVRLRILNRHEGVY